MSLTLYNSDFWGKFLFGSFLKLLLKLLKKFIPSTNNAGFVSSYISTIRSDVQVKFTLTNSTTLADLLSLNLHNYEDEVKNIVDKAVKEMSMEKMLKELNETWAILEFEHDKHLRTGITMLRTSEELIETLEENQVKLVLHSGLLFELVCALGTT